jgi:hypothetical protein
MPSNRLLKGKILIPIKSLYSLEVVEATETLVVGATEVVVVAAAVVAAIWQHPLMACGTDDEQLLTEVGVVPDITYCKNNKRR